MLGFPISIFFPHFSYMNGYKSPRLPLITNITQNTNFYDERTGTTIYDKTYTINKKKMYCGFLEGVFN